MPWKIRFLDKPPLHGTNPESGSVYYDGTLEFSKFVVGDMAYYHYKGEPCRDPAMLAKLHLTKHYFTNNAARPPLVLALPDHSSKSPLYFLVDGQCYSNTCVKCGQGMRKHTYKAEHTVCANGQEYTPKGHYDGWTVSGTPPLITVHPSVNYDSSDPPTRRYHGFVQNGVIGDG